MRKIYNSRVCVIGGAGFLGSHMVDHVINDRYCDVLVLDNLISGHRKHIHPRAEFKWFDLRDPDLSLVLKDHRIDWVFNYAAEPYIPECFERPMHFFDINAAGVLNVLQACTKAEVKGLLQVSSAEIYGDSTGTISEDAMVIPHSTYGVSKQAADGLVQVRWKEAGTPAIAMRQFNCVGERETHEYVIPEIISQIHAGSGDMVSIHLGNNSTRDFLYAYDAVRMAAQLLEFGHFGEVYNVGSETCIAIYDLARLIGALMGVQVEIHVDQARVRPWEIWHLQSNNDKLYSVIEARPIVTLQEALQRTIGYFHANGNKWDW